MKIIQIWFIMVCWKKRDTYGVEILIFSTLVDALLLVRPKEKKTQMLESDVKVCYKSIVFVKLIATKLSGYCVK